LLAELFMLMKTVTRCANHKAAFITHPSRSWK